MNDFMVTLDKDHWRRSIKVLNDNVYFNNKAVSQAVKSPKKDKVFVTNSI